MWPGTVLQSLVKQTERKSAKQLFESVEPIAQRNEGREACIQEWDSGSVHSTAWSSKSVHRPERNSGSVHSQNGAEERAFTTDTRLTAGGSFDTTCRDL